eukprot:11731028-Alexandrium_andersonii.AAC.1
MPSRASCPCTSCTSSRARSKHCHRLEATFEWPCPSSRSCPVQCLAAFTRWMWLRAALSSYVWVRWLLKSC